MPSGPRIRTNNVFGTVTDNPLTAGATTLNSAGLADLAAVSSAHAVIVLDPLRSAGAPEIAVVTAHTASATSATVTRGAFGTTARQHAAGVLWVHAPTIDDAIRILTSSTRPSDPYEGQMIYETDTDLYSGYDGSAWRTVARLGGWSSYTPTLTQSGAVTKTSTYTKYNQVGKTVTANAYLTITGTGTAANAVKIGLPVAAAATAATVIGTGYILDTSANLLYTALATLLNANEVQLIATVNGAATSVLGAASFTAALASGDLVQLAVSYEAS